ncbi:unnamed protein product [Heterosigma akashiwo]|mmetsp:Transcript_30900/g.53517  ORF Transcript_30900/g.53517 Transcript_30900/m.53517 type:complete len:302 (+) Transcript_30900:95-1000(+)
MQLSFLVFLALFGLAAAFKSTFPSANKVQNGATSMMMSAGELKKVTLSNGNSEAEIYTLGACVTSFKVDGYDYLMCRPDAKFDGSKPISGGLPFCWPQFGPGEIQQHGFARNLDWELAEEGKDKAVFKLSASEETRAMWPKEFELTYTVALSEGKLSTVFEVANTGGEAFSFTGALHSYYRTSEVDRVKLMGPFKGASFLDKTLDPPSMVESEDDAVTVSSFIERVYPGLYEDIQLVDGQAGKALRIKNVAGYRDTVVWNPFGDENMGASGFLCVESANVMEPVTVEAGHTWTGQLDLEAK